MYGSCGPDAVLGSLDSSRASLLQVLENELFCSSKGIERCFDEALQRLILSQREVLMFRRRVPMPLQVTETAHPHSITLMMQPEAKDVGAVPSPTSSPADPEPASRSRSPQTRLLPPGTSRPAVA